MNWQNWPKHFLFSFNFVYHVHNHLFHQQQMIKLVRTNSDNPDFIALVKQLDAYLAIIDGEDHAFYDQFNKIDKIKHVVVAYVNDQPMACGAIKEYEPTTTEIKRMYTSATGRGQGLATQVLTELENWATELGYKQCVLETGKRQEDAIALYQKNGYMLIPNYGQYADIANSVCFQKILP